jgi:hypothetical protein
MVGTLIALIHNFIKNKFVMMGAALLLVIGFVCYTIGMFKGVDLVLYLNHVRLQIQRMET